MITTNPNKEREKKKKNWYYSYIKERRTFLFPKINNLSQDLIAYASNIERAFYK